MADNTIKLAKTIEAFTYNSDNTPNHLLPARIQDSSIANAKLVHDEITINNKTVALGGSITINGGNTPPAHVDVNVNVNRNAISTHDTDFTRVATVTATENGTNVFDSITNANTSQGSVSVSGNTLTLSVPDPAAGTIRVTFDVTYTDLDSETQSHSESFSITVNVPWYAGLLATEPTAVSDLTDEGALHVGDQITLTNNGDTTLPGWAIVPDASSIMFETTQGFRVLFTDTGTNVAGLDLIRFDGDGVEPGDTNVIVVKEV